MNKKWKCSNCGCEDVWFDRTLSYLPNGVDLGMQTFCENCGQITDKYGSNDLIPEWDSNYLNSKDACKGCSGGSGDFCDDCLEKSKIGNMPINPTNSFQKLIIFLRNRNNE
jgi:hypothetical protein